MDVTLYFQILAFVLPVFWLLHIIRRLYFWLYFWQLKEYRTDRFLDGIKENKPLLFPRVSIWSVILLLALSLSLSVAVAHYLFIFVSFILYLILGLRALYFFIKKEWRLPKFTYKIIVLSFFCGGILLFVGIQNSLYLLYFVTSPFNYFLSLFLFDIFFPLFITFFVLLLQVPTFLIRRILIRNAKEKMKKFKNLLVVGITGSYGKTSTKEFLFDLLSSKYKTLKTPANQNSEIGVAKTVLEDLKEEHEIFICEMGAYKKGEIEAICKIVHPRIGILTGISGQHISLFKSLKNIINTKYELIAALPKNGIAIFNATNEECRKLAQRTSVKKYIYSLYPPPKKNLENLKFDVWAQHINETPDFIEFQMKTFKGNEKMRLNLLGKYNVENFLGAVTYALHLEIPLISVKEIASNIVPSKTSLRKRLGERNTTIIDDSYSQNPDGVFAAIEYIKKYNEGNKIILMPCLIELGKAAPSFHKSIGRAIGKTFNLAIITTPFYFEEIKIGAMEAGLSDRKILFLNDPRKVLEKVKSYFSPGDVILIEGRINKQIIEGLILQD